MKNEPGTKEFAQDMLDHLKDDEPVFVLRGGDALANFAVTHWITTAMSHNVNSKKMADAYKVREKFHRWRDKGKIKLPD